MNKGHTSPTGPASQLSGRHWARRFEGSDSLTSLHPLFRSKVESFVRALQAAGATVRVAAAFRTSERAYLMHWSWRIVKQGFDPAQVPPMQGVDILWAHTGPDGKYSRHTSRTAAATMVQEFAITQLGVAPALKSRHTAGCAIDMKVQWQGDLSVLDASGNAVTISSLPRSALNTALHAVGATYGVIKYNRRGRDDPHWSDTGV
jgi:hypothetical protein